MDEGVDICPGVVRPGFDGVVSRPGCGGGAVVKDGMEDSGDAPAGKLGAAYRRGWSARGLGTCGGARGGIGGRGSWPWGAEASGLGATASLMLWTSWTSSSNLLPHC